MLYSLIVTLCILIAKLYIPIVMYSYYVFLLLDIVKLLFLLLYILIVTLCILIVMFTYSYYVCSVLCILFHCFVLCAVCV